MKSKSMSSLVVSAVLTESDVTLAMTSEAIIIGFNVRADTGARRIAEQEASKFAITMLSMT